MQSNPRQVGRKHSENTRNNRIGKHGRAIPGIFLRYHYYFEANWTLIDNLDNVQCTRDSWNGMLRLWRAAFEYYCRLVVTGFWRMRYIRTGNREGRIYTTPIRRRYRVRDRAVNRLETPLSTSKIPLDDH